MKRRFLLLLLIFALIMSCVGLSACDGSAGDGEDDMYLILVNKQNPLGADYIPENLADIDTSYTNGGKQIKLEKTALDALISMLDKMKEDGITNVTVTSAYRDYEYQKKLFDGYCAREKDAHPTWSDEEVRAEVLTYSAAPGTSEHQSGLCVDLFTTEMEGLYNYGSETPNNPYDKGFAETKAFEWLCENAYKYGFILRFPENKTGVTGYSYESWHYRYVGVQAAKEIHSKEITLEEYLKK